MGLTNPQIKLTTKEVKMKNQNDKLVNQIILDLAKHDKWLNTFVNYSNDYWENLIAQIIDKLPQNDKKISFELFSGIMAQCLEKTIKLFESGKFEHMNNDSKTGKIIIYNYTGQLLTCNKSKFIANAISKNLGIEIAGIPSISKTDTGLSQSDKLNIIKSDKSSAGFNRFMDKLNDLSDEKQKSRMINSEYNRIVK